MSEYEQVGQGWFVMVFANELHDSYVNVGYWSPVSSEWFYEFDCAFPGIR